MTIYQFLTDLQVVTDKHNVTGKDLIHVHGKVNPEKDGDKVEIELEEGVGLFKDLKLGFVVGEGETKSFII